MLKQQMRDDGSDKPPATSPPLTKSTGIDNLTDLINYDVYLSKETGMRRVKMIQAKGTRRITYKGTTTRWSHSALLHIAGPKQGFWCRLLPFFFVMAFHSCCKDGAEEEEGVTAPEASASSAARRRNTLDLLSSIFSLPNYVSCVPGDKRNRGWIVH